jgi:hypothetical protein
MDGAPGFCAQYLRYSCLIHMISSSVVEKKTMRRMISVAVLTVWLTARFTSAQSSPLEKAQVMAGAEVLTLDGDWANADSATRGIVRIVISGKRVHAWGSCLPKACDWGPAKGQPFASAVDRHDVAALLVSDYTSFSNGVMTVSLDPDGRLRVQRLAHYVDGRRSDASFVDYFVRKPTKP